MKYLRENEQEIRAMTEVQYTQGGVNGAKVNVKIHSEVGDTNEYEQEQEHKNEHDQANRGDHKERDEDVESNHSSSTNTSFSSSSSSSSYKKDSSDVIDMWKICAVTYGSTNGNYNMTMKRRARSRIISIYDGCTEYNMHQWNISSSSSPGFFVCKNKQDALRSMFPRNSKLLQSQRCIIRCRVATKDIKCRGNNGMLTTNRLRPVEIWDINKVYSEPGVPHKIAPHWEIVTWQPSGQWI